MLATFSSDVCERDVSILQCGYSWRNTSAIVTWTETVFLSHFYVASMFFMRRFPLIRHCASSPDSYLSNKWFLVLSNNLRFRLSLLLFHRTSITITLLSTHASSHLNTCPCHLKLLCCTFFLFLPPLLSLYFFQSMAGPTGPFATAMVPHLHLTLESHILSHSVTNTWIHFLQIHEHNVKRILTERQVCYRTGHITVEQL